MDPGRAALGSRRHLVSSTILRPQEHPDQPPQREALLSEILTTRLPPVSAALMLPGPPGVGVLRTGPSQGSHGPMPPHQRSAPPALCGEGSLGRQAALPGRAPATLSVSAGPAGKQSLGFPRLSLLPPSWHQEVLSGD